MSDIVDRLRATLTGHDTDEAMWRTIIADRNDAAEAIVRLRNQLHQARNKRGFVSAEVSRLRAKAQAKP